MTDPRLELIDLTRRNDVSNHWGSFDTDLNCNHTANSCRDSINDAESALWFCLSWDSTKVRVILEHDILEYRGYQVEDQKAGGF